MSRLRIITRSKLRSAGIASIVCVAAVALSGCVSVTQSGGLNHLTVWKGTTNKLMVEFFGPTCNQDVDRDGFRGTGADRGLCAFYILRGTCNNQGGQLLKVVCYAVTDPNWRGSGNLTMLSHFIIQAHYWSQGGADCLIGTLNGGSSRWQTAKIGQLGCRP